MKKQLLAVLSSTMFLLVASCSMLDSSEPGASSVVDREAMAAPGLKDGELALPANYREWPVFLADINKDEGKQIRDIYISPQGHKTEQGDDFPSGTISVMELWNVKVDSDGAPIKDEDGKMMKDDLSLIFLMGKSEGAGDLVDASLRNGDWVYAGYKADGVTAGGPEPEACRSCHISQKDTDWVFHYDEYFTNRDK